jgi:alkaline phosphatase D
VLWTRLAPEPANPEALGTSAFGVGWRVATDERMRDVVAHGVALASAELAHSVHVEVTGLAPRRDYFYQFDSRSEESPIGHFRTAPAADDTPDEIRFAFATCQEWSSGYYHAYRDMLARDLDLVVHLGDYIYEHAIDTAVRVGPVPEGFADACVDLRTYRMRHALHKLDRDLQAAHAAYPFVAIWDDHEVANDYSGLTSAHAGASAEFAAQRAAAYQAYYEHMPIRATIAGLPHAQLRIHRRLRYGRLAEFTMLDNRQYRSANPCGGDAEVLRCNAALEGDYTMLGAEQEQWVARGFAAASSRWNIVAQPFLLAELEHNPYEENRYWNDAWDGYPLARRRLLDTVVNTRLQNPVFLSGDWHSTFVNDLKLDFKDRKAAPIATEFVTPAITTGGDEATNGPYYGPMIPYNPHIKYFEGDRRGYFVTSVSKQRMQFDLRLMTSVEDPNGTGYAERSFVVEDGVPGAQPA